MAYEIIKAQSQDPLQNSSKDPSQANGLTQRLASLCSRGPLQRRGQELPDRLT